MPRKCCVPECKGNYINGPKVSVFSFPQQEELKNKWLKSICRDNFVPTKQSVVCELHFHSNEIQRTSSAVDSKTGKTITCSLSTPRLIKDAVPSQLPGCPKYLSTPSPAYRESPDERRSRIENQALEAAIEESVKSFNEYSAKISFSSLEDLQNKFQSKEWTSNEWIVISKAENLSLILIDDDEYPKVVCSVKINSGLSLSAYVSDVEITKLKTSDPNKKHLNLPMKIENFNELERVQQIMKETYFVKKDDKDLDNIKMLIDKLLDECSVVLPNKGQSIQFLKEQISLLKMSKRKYNLETTILCSLLYSISPHAYRFLRSAGILTLPCPSTVARLCNHFPGNPLAEQNDENFLRYVQSRSKSLSDNDKVVVLLMDEIHLNSVLDYKGGKVVGNAYNSEGLATSAHVFMINSVGSSYKDVVHILPVKKLTADKLHDVIKKIIMNLEKCGFEVMGVVADNNAINKKAMSFFSDTRSIQTSYPHPVDPNRPLFYIIDTVHLLKCIRNNWLNQKEQMMEIPGFGEMIGGVAAMSCLRALHCAEKNNLLKYGYGLTLKALYPSSIERQNVKLALKIFNNGIVHGLREYGRKHFIENWECTAAYIELICKWWDIVNVKTLLKGQRLRNRFQEPITHNSAHIFDFLKQFVCWLDEWEKTGTIKKLSKETHHALRHTTEGLLEMAKYWLESQKKKFFLPGKIQTDCLEDRFGKYRQMSGGNYHVSMRQVCETEKKLRIQNLLPVILKSQKAGEISLSTGDLNDEVVDFCINPDVVFDNALHVIVDEDDIEAIKDDMWPLLHYIGGYSAHSALKKLQCQYCEQFLVAQNISQHDSLIYSINRGGLRYPSEDVIKCIAYAFATTNKLLSEHEQLFLQQSSQRDVVVKISYDNLPDDLFIGHNCAVHEYQTLLKYIVNPTANILLNNYIKKINDMSKKKNVTNYKRFKPK